MKKRKTDSGKRPFFEAGVKIWISSDSGAGAFGEGKYRLLQSIADCGSLSKAAEITGISYRKAWGDIRKAEEYIDRQLIFRTRGGRRGGASQLTPFARNLLQAYAVFRDNTIAFGQREFRKTMRKLLHWNAADRSDQGD